MCHIKKYAMFKKEPKKISLIKSSINNINDEKYHIQQKLTDIWKPLLNIQTFDPSDNFFD